MRKLCLLLLFFSAGPLFSEDIWQKVSLVVKENQGWFPYNVCIQTRLLSESEKKIYEDFKEFTFVRNSDGSLDLKLIQYEENGKDRTRRYSRHYREEYAPGDFEISTAPFIVGNGSLLYKEVTRNPCVYAFSYRDEEGLWRGTTDIDTSSWMPLRLMMTLDREPFKDEDAIINSVSVQIQFSTGDPEQWYPVEIRFISEIEGTGFSHFQGQLQELWTLKDYHWETLND